MCNHFFLCGIATDPSLGKIGKHSLPQQTLMELLIEGITNREKICGSKEVPDEISKWTRVYLIATNEVTEIDWSFMDLEGSVELKWLPHSLNVFNISYNHLHGTVDLSDLPESLESFNIWHNRFEGSVDLTKLPAGMQKLHLYSTKLSGWTDLSQLPKTLISFHVSDTDLAGEICGFDGYLGIEGSKVKEV